MDKPVVVKATPANFDSLWPMCSSLLERGLAGADGEMDISQLRLHIVQGHIELFVAMNKEKQVVLAVSVSYQNFPNYRIAHIVSVGGVGATRLLDEWGSFKQYLKEQGATKIQGYCRQAQTRLWKKLGLQPKYQIVRADL